MSGRGSEEEGNKKPENENKSYKSFYFLISVSFPPPPPLPGKEKIIKKMLIEKETNCGQHSFTFSSAIFFHNLILSVSFFSFQKEKKKKETHGWFLMIGRFSLSLLRPIIGT